MNKRDKELADKVANIMPGVYRLVYESGKSGIEFTDDALEKFAALIREDEREVIIDEWWSIVQTDLENGVKSLNEQAAIKWRKEYPSMATFGEWIEARGNK